jgi:hypothetical protein
MAYVYRHIRLDKNEPFYIGIGVDNTYKRAKDKCRRSDVWKRVVKKHGYKVEILFDNISYDVAKTKEIEFISIYGRMDLGTGILFNMTDGGDGTINKIFSKEYREKLSLAAKNRYKDRVIKQTLTKDEQNKLSSERMKVNNPCKGLLKSKHHSFKGNIFVYKNDEFIGVFEGVIDVKEKLGVCASKVSACLVGKRKTHKGYNFKRSC